MRQNLLLTVLLSFFLGSTSLALEKIRFGSPLKQAPVYALAILAAEEKGFWKEVGVELDWVAFDGGGPLWRAVAAGSVDMGRTATTATVMGIGRGLPMSIVADVGGREEFYVFVPTNSPIREPNQLKGKKISVASLGGMAYPYGLVVVRALGLERQVKFVATGGARTSVAILRVGSVDALLTMLTQVAPLVYEGVLREILSVEDYFPKPWSALVIFSRNDLLKKAPGLVKKVVGGYQQATNFISNNRSWAVEKMVSFSGYQKVAGEGMYENLRFKKDAKVEARALKNVSDFIKEYGLLEKGEVPPVDKLYTREIIGD